MQPEQLLAVHFKLFLCQALPFKTKNVKDVDQAYRLVEPFDQVRKYCAALHVNWQCTS